MDVCFNTSDVMPTVFIGIYFYSYFNLNCSTELFLHYIIINILYSYLHNLMMNIVKQWDLYPDKEWSDYDC